MKADSSYLFAWVLYAVLLYLLNAIIRYCIVESSLFRQYIFLIHFLQTKRRDLSPSRKASLAPPDIIIYNMVEEKFKVLTFNCWFVKISVVDLLGPCFSRLRLWEKKTVLMRLPRSYQLGISTWFYFRR